jgi:isopropylmalate/homocitrate/citramalate synthase
MKNRIYIFDTTLRDGEQSPGASLNLHDKLTIAQQLARLNVDVIEAGFPVSSQVQFEATRLIAEEVKGPIVAALARVWISISTVQHKRWKKQRNRAFMYLPRPQKSIWKRNLKKAKTKYWNWL